MRATDDVWPEPAVAGGYELTHALYRDAFGERVPPARRRGLHGRIAACLERHYGARAAHVATDLAFHFEAGGEPDRAVPYLEAAAARAVRLGAHREAVALLDHAIALLEPVDGASDRASSTIRLSIALGLALGPLHGFAHTAAEHTFERARRLGEATNDPQLFVALSALTVVYIAQARLDRASEVTAQLLTLTERLPVPITAFAANLFAGMVRYHTGDLLTARRHLESALGVSDAPLPDLVLDLRTPLFCYLALTLLLLGHADQAREFGRQATAPEMNLGGPYVLNARTQFTLFFHSNLRDLDGLARVTNDATTVGEEYDLPIPRGIGLIGRGRLLGLHGNPDESLALLRGGLEKCVATGQAAARPSILGYIAEALTATGRVDEALATIAEAQALVATTGEGSYAAELHRLEGEAHRARGEDTSAERCFRKALEVAERQGARWWQLRTATRLARLLAQKGDASAARNLLEPIVDSFTEGLDTPDVVDAVALLGTLG